MAEKFHILDIAPDGTLDSKNFPKVAEDAATATEAYASETALDALDSLLAMTEPPVTSARQEESTNHHREALLESRAIASDVYEQASLLIEEVVRFQDLAAKLSRQGT